MVPLIEELGRASSFGVAAMVHQGIGMQPLMLAGAQPLIGEYIAKLSTAEMLAAYALTEPGAGSDALNGTSTATLQPDGSWVLDGAKQFITNARWAGIFQVFAQVEGKGLTAFLVDRDTAGTRSPPRRTQDGHPRFLDVRIAFDERVHVGAKTACLARSGAGTRSR
jgi:alkylation response protein AidB-like acyl-CoA dehydrogenase